MFTEYVTRVMAQKAQYELIEDDKKYYGSIKGFQGVWAQGKTLKECEQELREVLEEWLLIKVRKQQFVPSVRGYSFNAILKAA